MPMRVAIVVDDRALQRQLTAIVQRQMPFAMATATNAIAAKVIDAETKALSETFDQPRAFTRQAFTQSKGFGGQFASKRDVTAIIVAKPIQEAYLAPSEFAEPQSLGRGKRIRTPVNLKTGAGGNIPKDAIKRLLGDPDVFIGEVRGVNGLWQRPSSKRPKGGPRRRIKANTTGRLKLLVAFTRPVKVKSDLQFHERAERIVAGGFNAEFDRAVLLALRTAR